MARTALLLTVTLVGAACSSAQEPPGTTTPTTIASSSDPTTSGPAAPTFDLQGHRGARGLVPENTLPSFETALDLGVTTLEMDLHLSADGEVVVWHDPVVDPAKCRLAPGAPPDVPDPDDPAAGDALAVRSLTVEQLSWYRCDRNPDPTRFPDQSAVSTPMARERYAIVPLTEVFDLVDRYTRDDTRSEVQREAASAVVFNVETKRKVDDPAAIGDGFDGENVGPFERRLLEVVEEWGMRDRVTIQSFDPRSLRAIARADAGIRLVMLTIRGPFDFTAMAAGGAAVWSPKASTVTTDLVAAAHEAGLDVVPWTVNDVGEASRLIDAGVDGLITDRPDLITGP